MGTSQQVSDQMEEWFTVGACAGFVIAATHMPVAVVEDVERPILST